MRVLVNYKYEINMNICVTLHNRVLAERLMLLSLSKASEAGRRRDALCALMPAHLCEHLHISKDNYLYLFADTPSLKLGLPHPSAIKKIPARQTVRPRRTVGHTSPLQPCFCSQALLPASMPYARCSTCKEGQVLNLPTTVNVHVRRQYDLLCQQCLATLGRSQLSD